MRFMFARLVLITALTAILPLSAGAQDACTVDFGTHVGSPACPYQWVGVTSVAVDGSGSGLGFVGMTTQCRADFGPGARMCKSEEIMDSDTLNFNAIPVTGCWIRPSWRPIGGSSLDESGVAGGALSMSCVAWTATSGSNGLTLQPEGSFSTQFCGTSRPVACCKPFPVPAPSASLSLPIGVMGLVGLSMLKGSV